MDMRSYYPKKNESIDALAMFRAHKKLEAQVQSSHNKITLLETQCKNASQEIAFLLGIARKQSERMNQLESRVLETEKACEENDTNISMLKDYEIHDLSTRIIATEEHGACINDVKKEVNQLAEIIHEKIETIEDLSVDYLVVKQDIADLNTSVSESITKLEDSVEIMSKKRSRSNSNDSGASITKFTRNYSDEFNCE